MESILNSTKKILGLSEDYTAFDFDVINFINTAFSSLNQLGVGSAEGFFISGSSEEWEALGLPSNQLHMVKTYVYLRVRFLFDPPTTSYLIDAMDKQIKEHEWRLNLFRELLIVPPPEELEEVEP